jgi:hypothetical protein
MATSRSKKSSKSQSFEQTFFLDPDGIDALPMIPVDSSIPSDQDIIAIASALYLLIPENKPLPTRLWSAQSKISELR